MIKYEQIEEILKETNIQFSNINFDQIEEILPPYIAYYVVDEDNFSADGVIYFIILNIAIELIDVISEDSNALLLEEVLQKHEINYSKDISYSYDNGLKSVEYRFQVGQ